MKIKKPFTLGYANKTTSLIRDVVALLLGIIFLFYPDVFLTKMLIKVLGAVLACLGILQLIAAVAAMSFVGMGFMTFLIDGIVVVLGISLIFSDLGIRALGLLAGFALIWYAVADLISLWKVRQAVSEYEIHYGGPSGGPDDIQVSDDTIRNAREVDYKKDN